MTQINQQRLRELFESVMDLPPIDRAAVLDAACAGNGVLCGSGSGSAAAAGAGGAASICRQWYRKVAGNT